MPSRCKVVWPRLPRRGPRRNSLRSRLSRKDSGPFLTSGISPSCAALRAPECSRGRCSRGPAPGGPKGLRPLGRSPNCPSRRRDRTRVSRAPCPGAGSAPAPCPTSRRRWALEPGCWRELPATFLGLLGCSLQATAALPLRLPARRSVLLPAATGLLRLRGLEGVGVESQRTAPAARPFSGGGGARRR